MPIEMKPGDRVLFSVAKSGRKTSVFGTVVGEPNEEIDGMVRVYWDEGSNESLISVQRAIAPPLPKYHAGDRVLCYPSRRRPHLFGHVIAAAGTLHLAAVYDVLLDGSDRPLMIRSEHLQLSAVQELINAHRQVQAG